MIILSSLPFLKTEVLVLLKERGLLLMLKKQGLLEKVNVSQGNYDSYGNFPQHTHIIDYVWQKIQWKELRLIRFYWAKWHLTHIIQYLHMLLKLRTSKCHFTFPFGAWSILKNNNYVDITSVCFFKMSRDADFYLLVLLITCPPCWLLVIEGTVLSGAYMQSLYCTKLSFFFHYLYLCLTHLSVHNRSWMVTSHLLPSCSLLSPSSYLLV